MFQKSGVISGGAYDLQRKAQKWEEKELDQLRAKRDQLHETVFILNVDNFSIFNIIK